MNHRFASLYKIEMPHKDNNPFGLQVIIFYQFFQRAGIFFEA
jgi:hypothetical protein